MVENRIVDIDALIADGESIKEAIRRGTRDAMRQYIQAGESMVSWKDGKAVMIPPEELKALLAASEPSSRPG